MRYNDEVRNTTFSVIYHVANSQLYSWTTSTCYNIFIQTCFFFCRFIYGIEGHIYFPNPLPPPVHMSCILDSQLLSFPHTLSMASLRFPMKLQET